MKWLVACALVLVPALAAAHSPPPPPRIPLLARACPATATYAALETGLALYVQDGQGWHVAGIYEPRGRTYEALALEQLTVGEHAGFRFDVGVVEHTWASLDSVGSRPVVVAPRHALPCDGTRWRCTEIVFACATIVRGAAVWPFRGALSFTENQACVTGERSHTGMTCNVPEVSFLGWPP